MLIVIVIVIVKPQVIVIVINWLQKLQLLITGQLHHGFVVTTFSARLGAMTLFT